MDDVKVKALCSINPGFKNTLSMQVLLKNSGSFDKSSFLTKVWRLEPKTCS